MRIIIGINAHIYTMDIHAYSNSDILCVCSDALINAYFVTLVFTP